jgi:hypothetical protein
VPHPTHLLVDASHAQCLQLFSCFMINMSDPRNCTFLPHLIVSQLYTSHSINFLSGYQLTNLGNLSILFLKNGKYFITLFTRYYNSFNSFVTNIDLFNCPAGNSNIDITVRTLCHED